MVYSIIKKSELEGALRLDAEYYQPEYLEWLKQLNTLNPTPLSELATKIDVGFVSAMVDHFQDIGVPLLRTQNAKEFYIDLESDLAHIDEDFHKKLRKTQVFPGYVLLARSGSIGDACVVPNNFPTTNSADIILIKTTDKILPEYLAAFLNSKYGRFQVTRASSGGLQGHINLFSLEKLLIPVIPAELQEEIKQKVIRGLSQLDESKSFYSKAENLLLQSLGLSAEALAEVERSDLSYIVNLSDIKSAHRADAEYFQPKYEELISKIKNPAFAEASAGRQNAKLLEELVSMKKGIEPGSEEYQEEGKLFIRVSSLSKFGIEERDQKYLSEELYQKLKEEFEPKVSEILLTKDATPGVAYVLKEPVEGIIAGGILRLKLKTEIEPEYLALVINSMVGKMQAERDTGGSVIFHWRPDQIRDCLIPIIPKPIQQKIADLVRQSHEARKKSKELLEEAKRKVETSIETQSKGND